MINDMRNTLKVLVHIGIILSKILFEIRMQNERNVYSAAADHNLSLAFFRSIE